MSAPHAADVARWVDAVADEPALVRRYAFDRVSRRAVQSEATRARGNLAKHGLDLDGKPVAAVAS